MQKGENFRIRDKLTRKQIFTIPNILSFFRLALIPVIVWLCLVEKSAEWTVTLLLISGITDIADGFIARRFNMVSDFGKAIDPLADKLTQLAVLLCLISSFPLLILPISVMTVKEILSFILRLIVYKKTERVDSAQWHGKVTTVMIYIIMLLHIMLPFLGFSPNYADALSLSSILVTTGMMILSAILYGMSGIKTIVEHNHKK